jgi:hypothetical protein
MTEERKHAILLATALLSARAKGYFVDRAIDDAGLILERIDRRWPKEERSTGTAGTLRGT